MIETVPRFIVKVKTSLGSGIDVMEKRLDPVLNLSVDFNTGLDAEAGFSVLPRISNWGQRCSPNKREQGPLIATLPSDVLSESSASAGTE